MFPISDEFKAAIQRSHRIATLVEVYSATNELLTTLAADNGNISIDGTAATRRQMDIGCSDPTGDLTPEMATDLLHPLSNNYIRMYRGIWLDNEAELVPQGKFDIFSSDVSDTGDELSISIKGYDFSRKVQRARLLSNYNVELGTNYGDAIRAIIAAGVPGLIYNFNQVDVYTPKLTFGSSGDQGGGDRWKYAQEMAAAVGMQLFFDVEGVVRLKPVPNPATQPVVWEYKEGPTAMLLYLSRNFTKEETYNHVVVNGESTSNAVPVHADAIDDNPSSPTYIFGPYGDVPFFFRSSYITTEEQAQTVAEAKLLELLGTTENMQITATVNPAHEAGDIIRVQRARAKVDSVYVLDKFNVNLSHAQAMNMGLREKRIA